MVKVHQLRIGDVDVVSILGSRCKSLTGWSLALKRGAVDVHNMCENPFWGAGQYLTGYWVGRTGNSTAQRQGHGSEIARTPTIFELRVVLVCNGGDEQRRRNYAAIGEAAGST